ncbi:unnamed protein product [Gongylonema pulchrum]|uniref:Histone deacetylase n=1 Tax=Gongylonema pulchrum TaxID=637853 RepID=A0A183EFA6_9BILA|nr:unnamed protein product [Gongylonema pulchrum]
MESPAAVQQAHHPHTTSVPAPVSSPHFEPYYIPPTVHAMHGASDYQLRKVSSEPNLKMRIRAKLLNKGSSPLQSQNSAFTSAQRLPQSETAMDTDCGGGSSSATSNVVDSPTRLLASAPHLMVPSPSLPNLASSAQLQMDMSALLAHALYSPFVSMPTLSRSGLIQQQQHQQQPSFLMVDSAGLDLSNALSEGVARQSTKLDSRTLSSPLPLGGYPSLLKQQLHDLMLRRKSLVQEEPEDEATLEAQLFSRLQSGPGLSIALRTQLKTELRQRYHLESWLWWRHKSEYIDLMKFSFEAPIQPCLVYDSAMAKHHCVCGNNKNHVEHGERVQLVWSRLQERGLLEKCERVLARKAPLEMLRTVHAATYVTFFAVSPTACLEVNLSFHVV